jgi:uncharacterized membrane protein
MNIMSLAIALHVLSIVVWVGGMFFAHQVMRPAAVTTLEPPQRLQLWVAGFKRFFPWVWICIATVLITGLWMFFQFPKPPLYMHIMLGLGIVMMFLFFHVFFAPYNRLKNAVTEERWKDGGAALNQIRILVGINTVIGIITILVSTVGKYYLV